MNQPIVQHYVPNVAEFHVWCCLWWLKTKASIKVRCSWHWGVVFLVMTSYRDLQSMTAILGAACFHTSSGFCHGMLGFRSHSQASRNQWVKSTADDRANVSAANVLATTRSIFFEYHTSGLAMALFWWKISSWTAKNKPPFWLCCLALDAK